MTKEEKQKTTQISLFLNDESAKKCKDCLKEKLDYKEYPLNSKIGLEGKYLFTNQILNRPLGRMS